MEDWRKYASARDQLYHLMVKFRQLERDIPSAHRTQELQTVLETVVRILEEARTAFENGEVMAVQIDRYHQTALPGIEDQFPEMKNPYAPRKD